MKTATDIQKEISRLRGLLFSKETKPSDAKIYRAELEKLEALKRYLELNPTEAGIRRQLEKVDREITAINNNFETWNRNHPVKGSSIIQRRKSYDAQMNLPQKTAQKETLTYILGE